MASFLSFRRQCPDAAAELGRGVVLLYHRVARLPRDPFDLAVTPDMFREQVEALSQHWPVLPLQEGWRRVQASEPGCWVSLTFDDAYRDVLEQWPVLEQLGLSATVFACTHAPQQEFWWDRLPDPALQAALRKSPDPQVPEPNTGRAPRLLPGELRELAQRGAQIGNHGHRHLSLPALTANGRREELQVARQDLQAWTGQPVTVMAYPYGDVDGPTQWEAREHADLACGVEPDLVWKLSDRFHLPRFWAPRLGGRELVSWLQGLF